MKYEWEICIGIYNGERIVEPLGAYHLAKNPEISVESQMEQ